MNKSRPIYLKTSIADTVLHRQSVKVKKKRYCLPIKIIKEEASGQILQTLKAQSNTIKSAVLIN